MSRGGAPWRGMSKTWVVYLYFLCEKIPRPKRGYKQIVKAFAAIGTGKFSEADL
jgi:hypothetical protein